MFFTVKPAGKINTKSNTFSLDSLKRPPETENYSLVRNLVYIAVYGTANFKNSLNLFIVDLTTQLKASLS